MTIKRSLTLLPLALLVAILFIGMPLQHVAAQDKAKTMGKPGDILTPLAIGNAWVYETAEDDPIVTDRIEGIVLFDGHPWYLLRTYEHEAGQPANKGELVGDAFWLTHKDGHEWDASLEYPDLEEEEGVVGLKLSAASKYYRYPAALGDKYTPSADMPTMQVEVIAINEKVKTKAGEFNCIVYKETDTDMPGYSFTSWVSPGVGIVKNKSVDEDGTYESELTSFTLVEEE